MNKRPVVKAIIARLQDEMALSLKAARTAHEEATGEGSKAEHKYDTRGLEAAYLAGAQAKQAAETERIIALYQSLELHPYDRDDPIDMTALIDLESEGERFLYFLGPAGGGLDSSYKGKKLLVITPQSPLGQNLIGKKKGDRVKMNIGGLPVEYRILSVC